MKTFIFDNEIDKTVLEEGKCYRKILAHSENVMAVKVYFKNGGIGAAHSHMHEQICYCLEGKFEYVVDGINKIISAGDCVYIAPNVIHGCRLLSEEGILLDIFSPQRDDFLTE
jgi:quercetin dioxygenase-like cupin family protein